MPTPAPNEPTSHRTLLEKRTPGWLAHAGLLIRRALPRPRIPLPSCARSWRDGLPHRSPHALHFPPCSPMCARSLADGSPSLRDTRSSALVSSPFHTRSTAFAGLFNACTLSSHRRPQSLTHALIPTASLISLRALHVHRRPYYRPHAYSSSAASPRHTRSHACGVPARLAHALRTASRL